LVQAFGGENVVVVSDHGFALEETGGTRAYGHDTAPDGVFIAAGPAFRNLPVDGLSVYDILPLLLYLKGFPVADDLAGQVPRAVFEDRFLRDNAVARVATYGARRGLDQPVGGAVDDDLLARLRALGYVK
jgi:hypothetical protein